MSWCSDLIRIWTNFETRIRIRPSKNGSGSDQNPRNRPDPPPRFIYGYFPTVLQMILISSNIVNKKKGVELWDPGCIWCWRKLLLSGKMESRINWQYHTYNWFMPQRAITGVGEAFVARCLVDRARRISGNIIILFRIPLIWTQI